MKNKFTFVVFLWLFAFTYCTSNSLLAQVQARKYLLLGSAALVSGMLDGTKESLSYHYDNGFKRIFHHANNQFWNPNVSWVNKYKNGNSLSGPKFAGSTNILVCTTDAYHLLRTMERSVDAFAVAYYINSSCHEKIIRKKKWKLIARDFLLTTAIRSIGFNITYNFIFNPSNKYLTN